MVKMLVHFGAKVVKFLIAKTGTDTMKGFLLLHITKPYISWRLTTILMLAHRCSIHAKI
jgi:hypothetical protein